MLFPRRITSEHPTSFSTLVDALRRLGNLELLTRFFNKVFSFPLYVSKLMILVAVICGGFSSIRLAHVNPLLASIYFLCAVSSVVCYISIYQLAFKITTTSEDLKKVIEVKSFGLTTSLFQRKWIEQGLRSVPALAINVGGFHVAERESVPRFLDYVVDQIVSLLITF